MQAQSVLNLGHVFEMLRVGNAQTLHAVSMAPLLEMLFESASTPVAGPPTDLALVLLPEAVQLIQPVGNRFAVPPHGQRLRVVLQLVLVIRVYSVDRLRSFRQDLHR